LTHDLPLVSVSVGSTSVVSNPIYAIVSWTVPINAYKVLPMPEPYNPADDINNFKPYQPTID
jgi:hypothetical protein